MHSILIIASLLLLSACTVRVGPPPEESSSTASQPAVSQVSSPPSETPEAPSERETHNVTYRGIVQPAGISIYMQGSHRLVLPDGRFVLLESQSLDLNGYTGEEVELSGSTRATIESKGIIMRVEKAKLILPPKEESAVGHDEVPELVEREPAERDESEETSSEPNVSNDASTSAPSESEQADKAEPVPSQAEEADQNKARTVNPAVIEAMANEKFAAEHWTQEYCTSHIGFCIPVHRNWWYKSFGTTTSALWHVEVGNFPVLNLGDGPIILNLLSGELSLENNATFDIRTEGNLTTASRPWSNNRHVEIRADTELKSAVRYMIDHITPYEGN